MGSPKKAKSASMSLGSFLTNSLHDYGFEIEIKFLYTSIDKTDQMEALFSKLDHADLVILSSPLYVDCLPAVVIRFMEKYQEHREIISTQDNSYKSKFVSILNCGFPESEHNHIALSICKQFSSRIQWKWLGGLAIGMGGFISGRNINHLGAPVKKLTQSLKIAAEYINKGEEIPENILRAVSLPLMPKKMYTSIGNLGWKKMAKNFKMKKHLKDRPYS
ncbi:MAG: NAD(P)H-dependent oxidoreductase [Candidatus Lokiarchaeota archaeon]|nr:NAD(P)H-dependent oxidoreductase [Candidatus Harpocratesius repetitus]